MNTDAIDEKIAALQIEVSTLESRNALSFYKPYPKQLEFHQAGKSFRERLFMAGNQLGKTFSGGFEVAIHATGRYPDWWDGKRFDKPIQIWTGAVTNEKSKGVVQKILLGTTETSNNAYNFGTGSIPGDAILSVTTRQAGVKSVADEILVKHLSGGTSRIALLTYEQGRAKWQGEPIDLVWLDEEPDEDIYSEAVTRTNATGGITMMTFTPLNGMSNVVERFMNPEEGSRPRSITIMTIYDAEHYSPVQRADIISSYEDYERETRTMGVPMMGQGRVFPFKDDAIQCDPIKIQKHLARIVGLDFGLDHPCGIVWVAWDRDQDIVYITDCFRKSDQTPDMQSLVIRSRGKWMPVAWPHDGLNREKSSGIALMNKYIVHGVNMLLESARYQDEKGGGQDVEPWVTDMTERIQTGRLKVFSTCTDWFDEFRMYHRNKGVIVPMKDDLMSATRYAMMMLRYAMPDIQLTRKPKYRVPIIA